MMDDIARQIDRAWSLHEPERDRVPAEIWRRVRSFKRDLAPTACIIERVLKDQQLAQPLIEKCIRRRGVARQQFLSYLRKTLPGANVRIAHKEILEVSWLSPRPPMFAEPQHPGELQDCVLVCFLAAWPVSAKVTTAHSAWALEVPDHAAARFWQRDPQADLSQALFEAALNFVSADADIVRAQINNNESVYLRAGSGCFACTVIGAQTTDRSKKFTYARARTWLHDDMLGTDQVPLPPAPTPAQSVALNLWRWADPGGISTTPKANGHAFLASLISNMKS
jgi:hypothetical protein